MNKLGTIVAIVCALASVAEAGKKKHHKVPAKDDALIVSPSQVEEPAPAPAPVEPTPAPVVVATAEEISATDAAAATKVEATAAAKPADENVIPELKAGPASVKLFGSLRPSVGAAYRSEAVERDRLAYGVSGSRIDLGGDITVGGGVSATLYTIIGTETNSEGSTVGKISLERALVNYSPIKQLRFSIGRDAVPLSAQSATPTVARVFPYRIGLDTTFVLPADVGLQAAVSTKYVTALAGVWNGIASDVKLSPGNTERGLLYSGRVELTPLGPLGFDERARPTDLRIGIGAATTYRAAQDFTLTGETSMRTRDLRASLSARAAWQGLFVQAELLRRQITDDLTMRPDVATAGYVQASWRFRAGSVDIAPLGRVGIEHQRQLSAPADGSSAEIGAAIFPLARGTDRLQISTLVARYVDPILGSTMQVFAQARLGF
ncbi:MAG TPA: porin [Kofleriaceae bacterium]|jgi:hypothetical protein